MTTQQKALERIIKLATDARPADEESELGLEFGSIIAHAEDALAVMERQRADARYEAIRSWVPVVA